ncbi:MAG: VOC family protein [Verrucomicrobia bacterium]|nr:VOC family protein [Prolixibacteraceae bacterium]
MKSNVRVGLILYFFLGFISISQAQGIQRPEIWGIAKMTFLVSDYNLSRDYYDKFLGFNEAFSYPSERGKVLSFKVNDRQFLEFVEDSQAKEKKRMVSVSFETPQVEQMRKYLELQGQEVPDRTTIDGAGNEVFSIVDPYGNRIEFIQWKENSLHQLSKGKYISDRRISKRIHHVGLYSTQIVDNDPFYVGILKFIEVMRYPDDKTVAPFMLYLGMGDCVENIEFYPLADQNFNHPCFLVDDMQETVYTLKERRTTQNMSKPMIGKGRKWILNITTADQTKVEFTEAHCVR